MRDAIGKFEQNKARGSYSATLLGTYVGVSLVIRPLTRASKAGIESMQISI
jgi:hypothetical protein